MTSCHNRLAGNRPTESIFRGPWNGEPTMREILEDPIVNLVMARDRVRAEDVTHLMASMCGRLSDVG